MCVRCFYFVFRLLFYIFQNICRRAVQHVAKADDHTGVDVVVRMMRLYRRCLLDRLFLRSRFTVFCEMKFDDFG